MPSGLKPSRPRDPGAAPIVATRWQDLSFGAKIFYFASAIDRDKESQVFTIHMTKPTRDQLAGSPLSPRDFLAQRMRTYMSGLPYFFVLDVSRAGVLHIHGLINRFGLDHVDLVRRLHQVAGDKRKIETSTAKWFYHSKSVDFKPVDWAVDFSRVPGNFGPYGWNHYITKDSKKVKKKLGLVSDSQIISVAQSVTSLAKELHTDDVAFGRAYSPD